MDAVENIHPSHRTTRDAQSVFLNGADRAGSVIECQGCGASGAFAGRLCELDPEAGSQESLFEPCTYWPPAS